MYLHTPQDHNRSSHLLFFGDFPFRTQVVFALWIQLQHLLEYTTPTQYALYLHTHKIDGQSSQRRPYKCIKPVGLNFNSVASVGLQWCVTSYDGHPITTTTKLHEPPLHDKGLLRSPSSAWLIDWHRPEALLWARCQSIFLAVVLLSLVLSLGSVCLSFVINLFLLFPLHTGWQRWQRWWWWGDNTGWSARVD